MGPNFVVVPAPVIDHNFRFDPVSEPLHGETLVAEFAVKTFVRSVLPWLAWIDQRRLDFLRHDPLEQRGAHELGTIVASHISRCAVNTDQPAQPLDDPGRPDRAGNVDCQTFTRVLVNDRQTLQLVTIGTRIKDEVVAPDSIAHARCKWPGARASDTTSAPFARHLQPRLRPQPAAALLAHDNALATEHDADPSRAEPGIVCGKPPHRLDQKTVLARHLAHVAQVGPADLIQRTRSSLAQPARNCIAGLLAAYLYAHHFFAEISFMTSISRSRSATS